MVLPGARMGLLSKQVNKTSLLHKNFVRLRRSHQHAPGEYLDDSILSLAGTEVVFRRLSKILPSSLKAFFFSTKKNKIIAQ